MDAAGRAKPYFIVDRLSLTVAGVLLGAAAVSWLATSQLMPGMMSGGMGVGAIVSSFDFGTVASFELVWIVGMAAMMFPAMIPIAAFYDRFVTKDDAHPNAARLVGTPLFLLGYLLAYGALGLAAYAAVYGALRLSVAAPVLGALGALAPSLVLVIAGLYQLTGLKVKMLAQCISPIGFFATRLHRGFLGALRMGFSHGTYCATCCWAFMLVMLAVAWMSLPFMAALAGVIILEKVVVRGSRLFTRAVGVAFFVLAVAVYFYPTLLAFQ